MLSSDLLDLVSKLTLEQKVQLVSGADSWHTAPADSIGLGAMQLTDGPNGARGAIGNTPAVCTPASISLAATFDPANAAAIGALLGREAARRGAQVLLAPTVNIARHPLGGRNFESFGEDPFLTAPMALAYIDGVQSEGVGACVKHLVANDVEHNRLFVSSEVDQRTLREVYLYPFEQAVAADVWSIMTAYPKLNGVHCTHDRWLETELLRDEWGFDGLVVSDWGAAHGPDAVTAGLDLEMPGPPEALGPELLAAIQRGDVAESDLDARVARIIQLAQRTGRMNAGPLPAETTVDDPSERELVRATAADGMVLLRNESATLPLAASTASIAVIGPNATPGVSQGGGSAALNALHHSSPLDGVTAAFPDAEITHHVGCLSHRYLPVVDGAAWSELELSVFPNSDLQGEPAITEATTRSTVFYHGPRAELDDPWNWSQRWEGRLQITEAGRHHFSLISVGGSRMWVNGEQLIDNWLPEPGDAFFGKASPEVRGAVDLDVGEAEIRIEWTRNDDPHLAALRFGWLAPIDEAALLAEATEAAAAADVAVVVVGLDAEWETESEDRKTMSLPGPQVEMISAVAAAARRTVVVVNAGSAVDLGWADSVDAVLLAWYPGQEFGLALGDVLTGAVEPGGRSPLTFPKTMADAPTYLDVPGDPQHLYYREGVFVGNRYYSERGVEPAVSFGFGLGYASITAGPAQASGDRTVTVPVTAGPDRGGKAVVQAYIEPPSGPWRRPSRMYVGSAVTRLDAGATADAVIEIPERAFEVWGSDGWTTPEGTYRVHLGWSAGDLFDVVELTR